MPVVKTPEERGPFGAWAYSTRDLLGLSPEQVVLDLGKYNAATLRKAEADSRDMSGPLWRALVPYYQRVAEKRGVSLPPPPRFGTPEPAPPADQAALITALTRQTAAIEAQTTVMGDVLRTLESVLSGQSALTRNMGEAVALALGHPIQPEGPNGKHG